MGDYCLLRHANTAIALHMFLAPLMAQQLQ